MKNTLTGILAATLLLCVLLGNAAITAMSINKSQPDIVNTIAPTDESVCLPVLMYHHMLKDENRRGAYVISPTQFECDLKELSSRGYTCVTTSEIIDYMETGKKLPSKPILITFDDGYESFYAYAYPLLQKYNMPAVVNIIGKYTDLYSGDVVKNLSYSHANWGQLREMQESSLIEIGNHSYDMHKNDGGRKGIKKLQNESAEQYHMALMQDIGALNTEIETELALAPKTFAYPFGAYSNESDGILKELGFKVIFTCEEKVNHLITTGEKQGEPIRLNRFNRAGKYSSESFFDKFTR